MATVTVRGNWQRAHDRVRRLQSKLEHPYELTARLAGALRFYLGETAPVDSMTLLQGLAKVMSNTERHAGLGDPQVLTDWGVKAPPGTIAEFVRWLKEENSKRRTARTRWSEIKKETRAGKRTAFQAIRQGRAKQLASRVRGQKISGGRVLSRFYAGTREALFGKMSKSEATAWQGFKRGLARRNVYVRSSGRFVRMTYRRQKTLAYLELRKLRFGRQPISAEQYALTRYDIIVEFTPER